MFNPPPLPARVVSDLPSNWVDLTTVPGYVSTSEVILDPNAPIETLVRDRASIKDRLVGIVRFTGAPQDWTVYRVIDIARVFGVTHLLLESFMIFPRTGVTRINHALQYHQWVSLDEIVAIRRISNP